MWTPKNSCLIAHLQLLDRNFIWKPAFNDAFMMIFAATVIPPPRANKYKIHMKPHALLFSEGRRNGEIIAVLYRYFRTPNGFWIRPLFPPRHPPPHGFWPEIFKRGTGGSMEIEAKLDGTPDTQRSLKTWTYVKPIGQRTVFGGSVSVRPLIPFGMRDEGPNDINTHMDLHCPPA